jgi:hypothetical protein
MTPLGLSFQFVQKQLQLLLATWEPMLCCLAAVRTLTCHPKTISQVCFHGCKRQGAHCGGLGSLIFLACSGLAGPV